MTGSALRRYRRLGQGAGARIAVAATGAVLVVAALGAALGTAAFARAQGPTAASASVEIGQPTEPAVLRLTDFVRRARATYPGLEAASHRGAAAEARLDEAIYSPFFQFSANAAAGLAPQVTGSPIYSRDSQLPVSNPWEPVLAVGIEGVVPLWTFGKLSSARDAARAGVKAAKQNVALTEQRVVYDVRRAYFGVQMALDILQMLDEGEGKLETAEKKLSEKLLTGDADVSPQDKYRLATSLAELRGRRAEAQKLENSARDALRMLTGVDAFEVPECPLAEVPFESGPVTKFEVRASKQRPELGMLEAGLRARKAQANVIDAQYLPDIALGLAASYSYAPGITDQTNPFIVDRANYQSIQAGLVARWNLDIVGNLQRETRADEELLETKSLQKEAKKAIELDVRTTYNDVTEARARMAAYAVGHKEARAWFVSAAQGYQVGTADPKDLIDAVKAYFTARFSHLQAIFDFNVAVAKLEKATASEILSPGSWELSCGE